MSKSTKVKRLVRDVGETLLRGYTIQSVLHSTGMSSVYLVKDRNGMTWVIKEVLKGDTPQEQIECDSILREARIMASISHPSIPRIVNIEEEVDEETNELFAYLILMDYVNGRSLQVVLSEHARSKSKISQKHAVGWMIQVCGILSYLHAQNPAIVYLDMKPSNIMIRHGGGGIVLLDFGISQVVTPDNREVVLPLGTKGFAAPEQGKRGTSYHPTMDIHAVGATLFTLLTGVLPTKIQGRNFSIRAQDGGLSEVLDEIIMRCTQKDPAKRYQSVEELIYDLQNFEIYDKQYEKKARRKIRTAILTGVSGLVIGVSCLIPFGLDKNQQRDRYAEAVTAAEQTGRVSDYVKAISLKPTGISPYPGLIEAIKTDGEFTKEEEQELLDLINPSLAQLQTGRDYGELAYQIGRLYWFYYPSGGESGSVLSTKWFNDAITYEAAESEQARVLYDLGRFDKSISSAIQESNDGGMYKEYWDNLNSATKLANGEVIDIQLYNAMALSIKNYAPRMKSDGVKADELRAGIAAINKHIKEANPTDGRPKEMMVKLKKDSEGLVKVVDAAFRTVPGEE